MSSDTSRLKCFTEDQERAILTEILKGRLCDSILKVKDKEEEALRQEGVKLREAIKESDRRDSLTNGYLEDCYQANEGLEKKNKRLRTGLKGSGVIIILLVFGLILF